MYKEAMSQFIYQIFNSIPDEIVVMDKEKNGCIWTAPIMVFTFLQ